MTQGAQPTAGELAVALVAAARIMGIEPDRVFQGGTASRRTRILAGAALKAASGCVATQLAKTLRLAAPELSPSMLIKAGVTSDMMLEVVEAVQEGLPAPVDGASPLSPAAEAATPARKAARAPEPDAVHPVPTDEAPKPPPMRPAKTLAVPRRERSRRTARPVEPKAASTRPPAIARLKPVTGPILRWARWFVEADWAVEEVADLFGVHEDGLADALEFGVAG